ncbi:DNA alkylation repair protein [Yinghuangia seranimata]|uniref:DNA alkylation repair protein n=1 Tax=Yinghuangia seranimata TaxID=408067 RepID=UPI00248B3BB4|nr:DNA alkylation repair protein [Yinghuangia seranimata]MDI2130622.1 DNA alkylation repair protein [Yinghuangia seranimata]
MGARGSGGDGDDTPAGIAARLDAELAALADPVRAEAARAYLHSERVHYGVSVPQVRAAVRGMHRAHRGLTRPEILAVAHTLWAPEVFETHLAACVWLEAYVDRLEPEDTDLLAEMIGDAGTWALVDVLAGDVAGRMLLRLPELEHVLRAWAAQDEMWLRRSGVLGFLRGVRAAETYPRWFPVLGEVADPLLTDPRFFVRKVIGWVLREATKHHPDDVVDWVSGRLDRISGLTLREALKRVPDDRKAPLLRAHRAG